MSRQRTAAVWAALTLASLAGCAGPASYLNTSWGMKEKALRAARPDTVAAGEHRWLEQTSINGHQAAVTYRLGARGLREVTVVFEPVVVSSDQYIEIYHQVKALLSEKYGAPEADAADLIARSQKIRSTRTPDYQSPCLFRMPLALIQLTCPGACDGSAGNSITISYEPPRAATEGL
jgi:hypothetical protein